MRLIDADKIPWTDLNDNPNSNIKVLVTFAEKVNRMPTIERKTGKWLERHHAYADEEKAIEEWQSCKCSVCGRYDTRPYMYYFSEPRFCSWCGADMRGEGHERSNIQAGGD